ncbi:Flagellar biosynthesis protein FlhB [hydrothermal vent metagenome]|uniref:Flagellar biosynthetic protein FlhB n=1 Tax=hydrothermal vent metagenome TaxID=652676 RepID=A0A3B0R5K2_9ZZZZ
MADDQDKSQKTESATPQKLQEARKKGDVAKSQEIPSWTMLATSVLVVAAFLGPMALNLSDWLQSFFIRPQTERLDAQNIQALASEIIWKMFGGMAMVIGLLVVAGLAGHILQAGFMWAPDKIKPKPSKLSPIEGFKRLFGTQGLVNFAKGIGKMTLVGLVSFAVVWPRRDVLANLPYLDLLSLLPVIKEASVVLLIAAVSVFALIAAADYFYQRHSFLERMKMSRKDIRDELKNTEGDPQVRARLRQIRTERSRQRMMQAVPDASVVVVNPTHYAVALKYDKDDTPAPVCVAKGVDDLALRIRKLAEESGVPVIENPPLARALHANSEIDQEIPEEHFKAVAKVLGFILSRGKKN